jgi:hypothetical protein
MIKYIYVPEDELPSDYYEKAYELGISQIIHGRSDIISDFIENYSLPSIIEIPEFTGIIMPKKTFKENEIIPIIFVDEWIKQNSYNSLDCLVYSVDIDKPWIKELCEEINMKYDQNYAFFAEFSPKTYGEYYVEIVANYDQDKKVIHKDEIIVYREYKDKVVEEINDFKFEI